MYPTPPTPDFDLFDWYFQDTFGDTPTPARGYPLQVFAHDGGQVTFQASPQSGDWIIPAGRAALLVRNTNAGPCTITLPLAATVYADDDAGLAVRTVTIPAAPPSAGYTGELLAEGGALLLAEGGASLLPEGAPPVQPAAYMLIPVPQSVYGYEELPLIYDGIPAVAWIWTG
jgi:hypothetical protein